MHGQDWVQAATEATQWLAALPAYVWHSLAGRLFSPEEEVTGPEIADKAMRAAYTAMGYMSQEVFREAEAYPWRLGHGCIADNLEALAQ